MADPTLTSPSLPESAPDSNLGTKSLSEPNPRKKIWDDFRTRAESCKTYRRKLIANWTTSIDFRRGKPFNSQTDDDRIAVNLDWSLTKTKQAALFSQVPQVRVNHSPQTVQAPPWLHGFEQRLNETLSISGIESAMDECLPDVINAAGIACILVSYESISEMKDVPAVDPSLAPDGVMPDGSPIPMTQVPHVLDHRYLVSRISPSDMLWPINFTGSDLDNAPWVGRTGRITKTQAMKQFNLPENHKVFTSGDEKSTMDKLTLDMDRDKVAADDMVAFDEIFYKSFLYDADTKSYDAIHHLIFLGGEDEPILDEPWKGQSIKPDTNSITGSLKFPLRFLTLAYITDEVIPPSDSAIGRYQVNEINKARGQIMMQRERSIPVRWFDVNRLDKSIQFSLMRGTWQHMIPVQGNGANVLGEVAKAAMPQEDFAFDKIAKADLSEEWSVGPNQLGSGRDVDTKGEGDIIEQNFRTRISRERAKVGKFFCTIAEVLGGLMCISESLESFGEGFDPAFSKILSFSILADSTVLLDSNQRLKKLIEFVNFGAKSGWVVLEPVLKEIATLSGLDPNLVIKPPAPKPPTEPNISLRFTGIEDMSNPLALAFLINSGQAPSEQQIEQAKKMIDMSTITPQPIPPAVQGPPGPDGTPGKPVGGDLKFTPNLPRLEPIPQPPPEQGPGGPGGPPGAPNQAQGSPAMPPHRPQPPIKPPAPPEVGHAHPDWSGMPRINKRTEGEGGGDPNVK